MSFDKEGTYATSENAPALLGLLLLACLLLAGCQMDSTVEELFTLPRLPTEYTTLSRQLDQLLSEGYEYMAPTSGRNIQSLQMVDIDGDGRDEALAFFRLSNGEKPLKIYVFHSREDSYELAPSSRAAAPPSTPSTMRISPATVGRS